MALTQSERKLRAQLAAHTRWSKPGSRRSHGDKIREGKLRRHAEALDPDGRLDPAERARVAQSALNAEMKALAFKAARARSAGRDAA